MVFLCRAPVFILSGLTQIDNFRRSSSQVLGTVQLCLPSRNIPLDVEFWLIKLYAKSCLNQLLNSNMAPMGNVLQENLLKFILKLFYRTTPGDCISIFKDSVTV